MNNDNNKIDLQNSSIKSSNFSKSSLKKCIVLEYIFVIVVVIIGYYLIPLLADNYELDNSGIDGIGEAIVVSFSFLILRYICSFLLLFVYPIIVLCKNKEIKLLENKGKKFFIILLIIIPMIFSLLIIFERPISNLQYSYKHYYNPDAYDADTNNYKTSSDFERELDSRGFLYNEESVYYSSYLKRLNSKFDINYSYPEYYYEKATVMGLNSNYFHDSKESNDIISFSDDTKYPAYMYNSILYLETTITNSFEDSLLQYLPYSRYESYSYLTGNNYPFFKDYYIECKIMYVDDEVYAIIGVSSSYILEHYYIDSINPFSEVTPYYMIISENDSIKTYDDGKYYPNGSISASSGIIEMYRTTNTEEWQQIYPIKKVDRVNITTINSIAEELKNGVLKDSIQQYLNEYGS